MSKCLLDLKCLVFCVCISISSMFAVVRMIFVHVCLTDALVELSTLNRSWSLTQMTQFPFVSPIICTLSIHLGMVTFYFLSRIRSLCHSNFLGFFFLAAAWRTQYTIYNSAEYLWRKVFRMSKFAINIKIKQPTEEKGRDGKISILCVSEVFVI